MARISERLRQQVIDRARGCCEYCQTQQAIAVSMEFDHIIPEVNGGETHLDNLCYSCIGCNGFKLDFQTGIDPDTGHEVPLFHPRLERWDDHFQWSDDAAMLIGKTPAARATIARLRINRAVVVEARRVWAAAGRPPR